MHLKSFHFFIPVILLLFMASCDPHPGFEETESGIYKKLIQFGDCTPSVHDADYVIFNVSYEKSSHADSSFHFQVHHHKLGSVPAYKSRGNEPGLILSNQLDSMKCGDQYCFIIPYAEIAGSWLAAQNDSGSFMPQDEINFTIHALRTFTPDKYRNYLMTAAQQDELTEADAIELLLSNDLKDTYERHGECFIQHTERTSGDSIYAGSEVTIVYTTHLLDGTRLDTSTELTFTFGKPGQVIGGLQYALSFLHKGEQAKIYLPSYLAFGIDGNSNGLVPPKTPVYFELRVKDVKN